MLRSSTADTKESSFAISILFESYSISARNSHDELRLGFLIMFIITSTNTSPVNPHGVLYIGRQAVPSSSDKTCGLAAENSSGSNGIRMLSFGLLRMLIWCSFGAAEILGVGSHRGAWRGSGGANACFKLRHCDFVGLLHHRLCIAKSDLLYMPVSHSKI